MLGLSACPNLEDLLLDVSSATRYFDSESAEMMSIVWSAYLELLCHGAHFRKLRRTGLCVCVGDMQNDPVFSLDWSRLEDALHRLPALQTFLQQSSQIGGLAGTQAQSVKATFDAQRGIVLLASKHSKQYLGLAHRSNAP